MRRSSSQRYAKQTPTSSRKCSNIREPRRIFEQHRPSYDLSSRLVYEEQPDRLNESQRTLERCARLKQHNFMSPSVTQRRDLKRINEQIDNRLRRKK